MNTLHPITYHLIPTEEASDLILIGDWNKLVKNTSGILPEDLSEDESFQHLFLCNDEEIREGDYVIGLLSNSIRKVAKNDTKDPANWIVVGESNAVLRSAFKKIISCNSPALIKDGVAPLPEKVDIIHPTMAQGGIETFLQVPFLTEFCKFYEQDKADDSFNGNEKMQSHIKNYLGSKNKAEQKVVDSESSFTNFLKNNYPTLYHSFDGREIIEIVAQWQSLQSQTGYSLEDMKQIYNTGRQDVIESRQRGDYFDTMDEVIQSLTLTPPNAEKGVRMFCEMEKIWNYPANEPDSGEWLYKPKRNPDGSHKIHFQ